VEIVGHIESVQAAKEVMTWSIGGKSVEKAASERGCCIMGC
jgi:hypothetical protein